MNKNSDNYVQSLYNRMRKLPLGQTLFSKLVSRTAPYFSTISPIITELKPNYCACLIKKRKKVFNHIKTVHVIAICNGLEMAMGVMAEASIPKKLRWIPKGMRVDYTAKAATDILCVAEVKPEQWAVGDLFVPVNAYDTNGVVVVSGSIKLWVTERPSKNS